jgi:glycosyltransferase involved in cell wall biosynthesis
LDFSIIICSYNGSERLPKTLEYLSKLEIQQLDCEFIYVDNNSTDGSIDLVLDFWSNLGSPFPLVVETETNSGVGYARKKGCQVANGEFILFCDDDNWVVSNYLHILHRIFQDQPEIGIIGGKGIAVTEGEFPVWFSLFPELFAVGGKNNYTGYVEALPAAGMGIRKKLIQDYYTLFNSRFESRNKGKYTGGEDTEICLGVAWMGYRCFLTPELEFYHYIPARRLDSKHLFELVAGIANSQVLMESLRSIVLKVSFKSIKRLFRDIQWTILKFPLVFRKNRSLWYRVWLFYRYRFWVEYISRQLQIRESQRLSYWIKIESSLFTKYSQRSEKPFAGL